MTAAPPLPPTREPAEADLRDFLAAAALTGLVVNAAKTVVSQSAVTVARTAYQLADAMLAVRAERPATIPLPRPARGEGPNGAA